MKKNTVGLYVILLALVAKTVLAVKVDLGDCGCSYRPNENSAQTLSSHFIGSDLQGGKFFESIRGQKGDPGRTGEAGPEGLIGQKGISGKRGPPAADISKDQQEVDTYASCQNVNRSGIYKIKQAHQYTMQLYCETTVDGGGWRLVASVHENNIDGKCTYGDRWSSEEGVSFDNTTKSSNWANVKTFGHPEAATSSDYKSSAYFTLSSRDVMIWQVPNDSEMSTWYESATAIYYTNSHFLTSYGGSLKSLFSDHFPLHHLSERDLSHQAVQIALRMNSSSSEIRSHIPDFFQYRYDSSDNRFIRDGGNDMFDSGNKVYYQIGTEPFKQITYEKLYRHFPSGSQVYSIKSSPFVTYMWISNTNRSMASFALKVLSDTGADNSGSHASFTNELSHGNISCKFNAYKVFGASSDPSICEVFFYCYSEQLWGSVSAESFTRGPWSSTTNRLENGVRLDGSPGSVLLGYMLLSRTLGTAVTNEQINAVIANTMVQLTQVTSFPAINCTIANDSLAVPVTYVKGSNQSILADIPPKQRTFSTPGFVQFRPVSTEGRPNAICPGIKSSSCFPSFTCLGGIGVNRNSPPRDRSSCGDFADWQGHPGDNATATQPDGFARSLNYLKTSFLIFTR